MSDNLLTRILGWLRAGYPEGVPRGDYVALLGILHRQLTPTELDEIVDALKRHAAQGAASVSVDDIERVIAEYTFQSATDADIARVSARLAAGGWPLAGSTSLTQTDAAVDAAGDNPPVTVDEGTQDGAGAAKDGVLARIMAWLKNGYPSGVPQTDYIPLIALLRRRLSDEQVREVVDLLVADGALPTDHADIGAAIMKVTDEMPSPEDLQRVRDHLDESELDAPS